MKIYILMYQIFLKKYEAYQVLELDSKYGSSN